MIIQQLDRDVELQQLIDMIESIARLDFSKRLDTEYNTSAVNIIAQGLNMLSEELESNVVKRSTLEETNSNLERFSYTVAHDIRSPLNSAVGILSLMEMELTGPGNDQAKEYINMLRGIHERIANMVKGILEYSRTNFNNLKIDEINIEGVCNEIAGEYDGDTLTIIHQQNMPCLHYNEFAIRQIFSNIIGNAVKYNDKKNCIIHIGVADKDNHYEISVKDNGSGIRKENLKNVFDLYENLRSEKTNSYGIGLSIVKKIITQAGGSIWVESEPGEGANFIFTVKKTTTNIASTVN